MANWVHSINIKQHLGDDESPEAVMVCYEKISKELEKVPITPPWAWREFGDNRRTNHPRRVRAQ